MSTHEINKTDVRSQWKDVPTKSVDVVGTKFIYRELGPNNGVPVIFLNHLGAELDRWDPLIIEGIARRRRVIVFNNRGIGGSDGKTPSSIEEMASDAELFIQALGFNLVDLFGFSLGGFISQVIVLKKPDMVRKIILAGTGPAGGTGIDKVLPITIHDMIKGTFTLKHPEYYLFFTESKNGRSSAREFLARLKERTKDRDKSVSIPAFIAQLKAIYAWGRQPAADLSQVSHHILIANGEHDKMVPFSNSVDLNHRLSNSELIIYNDAGHGGIFQYHESFVEKALEFLDT